MSVEPSPDSEVQAVRRLLLQTVVSVLLIFAVALVAGVLFLDELQEAGERFVVAFGGGGLFACYFAMDAFLLPVPQDPFAALALAGGLPFWEIVFWAGSGSVAGGCLGYWFGARVVRLESVRRRIEGRLQRGQAFMVRWGVAAVLVAGITPFPYSVVCWVGGALQMSFWRFLIASLAIRYLRVGSYLWVIEKGLGV